MSGILPDLSNVVVLHFECSEGAFPSEKSEDNQPCKHRHSPSRLDSGTWWLNVGTIMRWGSYVMIQRVNRVQPLAFDEAVDCNQSVTRKHQKPGQESRKGTPGEDAY